MANYSFSYPSEIDSITALMDDLLEILENHRVAPELARHVAVAISEGFTNGLIHGNQQDKDKTITVALGVDECFISADIIDEGTGGLESLKGRKPSLPTDEGGRGIDLIEHYASTVEYSECATGGLKLSLTFVSDTKTKRVLQ